MHTVLLVLALSHSNLLTVLQQVGRRGASTFFDQMEAAAFIVAQPDGSLVAVPWAANTASIRGARYSGAIPAGTIAIAHTHPFTAELPSRGDLAQAKKIRLPIYTISQWSLYVADPSGAVVPLIVRHNWLRSQRPAEFLAAEK